MSHELLTAVERKRAARLGVILPAIVFASLIAWTILQLPLPDPGLVVGLPLVGGYSERAESAGWLAFVFASTLFGALLRWRCHHPFFVYLSLGLPVLLSFPFWVGTAWFLPLVGLLLLGLQRASRLILDRLPALGWGLLAASAFVLGMLAIAVGEWFGLALLLGLCLLISALLPGRQIALLVVSIAVLVISAVVEEEMVWVFLGGFLAVLLARTQEWWGPAAYVGVTTLAMSAFVYSTPFWDERSMITRCAALVEGAVAGTLFLRVAIDMRLQQHAMKWLDRWPLMIAVVSLAPLIYFKPWFASVLLLLVLILQKNRPPGDGKSWQGLLVCVGLLVAVLPEARPDFSLDGFHDGQLLSAVWQYDQGEKLYRDVFPLRSFEFWITWIGRRLLPDSIVGYKLAHALPTFLAIGGVSLSVFAWTRSALWSFVAGLLSLQLGLLDVRGALSCWIVAIGLILITKSTLNRHLGWAILGCASALAGFDIFVPMIASVMACEFFRNGSIGIRFLRAAVAFTLATLPWTILLGSWQGFDAAFAFWRLFVDFGANYNAFYGLPIPWRDSLARMPIFLGVVFVGLWSAYGPPAFRGGATLRESAWAFMLAFFTLYLTRGVGRSDVAHLNCSYLPAAIVAGILLWECMRGLNHRQNALIASIVIGVAVWWTPHGVHSPWSLARMISAMLRQSPAMPASDPWIQERTPLDGYLWDMENGIMNFLEQRKNPTRHALAYCIGTPAEQARAVADLQRRRPSLVYWRFGSHSDGIEHPLRYAGITPWILSTYRPSNRPHFLEPAPPDWLGSHDLPVWSIASMPMGWLPLRWGESLSLDDSSKRQSLQFAFQDNEWVCSQRIVPREWNWLVIELAVESVDLSNSKVNLDVAVRTGEWERSSRLSWKVKSDRQTRRYVIPLACHSAWMWRHEILGLRLAGISSKYRIETARLISSPKQLSDFSLRDGVIP